MASDGDESSQERHAYTLAGGGRIFYERVHELLQQRAILQDGKGIGRRRSANLLVKENEELEKIYRQQSRPGAAASDASSSNTSIFCFHFFYFPFFSPTDG